MSAHNVPAWKRLGLKLKSSAADEPTKRGPGLVGHRDKPQSDASGKRNGEALLPTDANSRSVKRARIDEHGSSGNKILSKSWSNSNNISHSNIDSNISTKQSDKSSELIKPKKAKKKKKQENAPNQQTQSSTALHSALAYLRQWKSSRDTWKFNKNYQTTIIKHIFDKSLIPAAEAGIVYDYIRDLKGFTRQRLRDAAMEIRTKDIADGSAGFPDGTADVAVKQEEYESAMNGVLQERRVSNKKRFFNETEFLATSPTDDDDVIRRLVKRFRAEMIIEELSDGETTDGTTITNASSDTVAGDDNEVAAAVGGDKRLKLNDGSGKRRRKLRVNDADDSSSSDSDSESDSGTSSSGSSSEESDEDDGDDDDDDDGAAAEDGYGTVSDSSDSSSSEDEGAGSDADSDEEDH